MNGIHDMGGMHGFGPIPIAPDEPLFHADWESRALALTLVMATWGRWNIDASRRAREEMHPSAYLNHSYYHRWIDALSRLLLETGLLTDGELRSGQGTPPGSDAAVPVDAGTACGILQRGGPTLREAQASPRFAPGEGIRTSNRHPAGHTRLPLYARDKAGVVVRHQGAHVFPDSNAHFLGEQPQHLYAVRFSAIELWGPEASAVDSVTLDLWESYLDHS